MEPLLKREGTGRERDRQIEEEGNRVQRNWRGEGVQDEGKEEEGRTEDTHIVEGGEWYNRVKES